MCGGSGDEWLFGVAGFDEIDGRAGDDSIFGGDGKDTLRGGTGIDRIVPGQGHDTADGGLDDDLIAFIGAGGGVNVNLAANTASGEGNPAAIGFEWVQGSNYNDAVVGNTLDNGIYGEGGDDEIDAINGVNWIMPGPGADIVRGGSGPADAVEFYTSTNGVDVDLAANTATGQGADTVHEFEIVGGSVFDDAIDGDSKANGLVGDAGDDTIEGNVGDDTLDGGDGTDTLRGGPGEDSLDGGTGTDNLNGGGDFDECTRGSLCELCELIL